MADEDWRVEADVDDEDHAATIGERLRALALEDDSRKRLGRAIVVTRDGSRVFAYAQDEDGAREAERVIRELLTETGALGEVRVMRWHPDEAAWEDASVPLPATEQERQAERARHTAEEIQEAAEEGTYDWIVRVHLAHRKDARELADRLAAEGMPVDRRWHYVAVGALTEEHAEQLATRLRGELPPKTEVSLLAADVPSPFVPFG
jgi:hypothetical protein